MEIAPRAPLRCAIGRDPNDMLYLAVRQYLDDLMAVAQMIYDHPTLDAPVVSGVAATAAELMRASTSGPYDGF